MGPPVEREAVRAMMFLRARSPPWAARGRARPSLTRCSPCSPRGSSRWFRSTARSGRAAISPARALRSRPDRRGRGLDPHRRACPRVRGTGVGGHRAADAHRQGGARADQRHGRHPRHAAARSPRPGPAAHGRRHHGRDVHGGPARHRPRLRCGPGGHAAPARPGAERREPHPAARRLLRSSRATVTATRVSRTRTRCAAPRR